MPNITSVPHPASALTSTQVVPVHQTGSPAPPPGSSVCAQLLTDRTRLQNEIAATQAKLNSTHGPEGPGTARGDLEQTLAALQKELASTVQSIAQNGCSVLPPVPPDCQRIFHTPHSVIAITGVICHKLQLLFADAGGGRRWPRSETRPARRNSYLSGIGS
jgi:hypothetical protein